jgi:endonuclease/exonuclease/phosphatase family metal-dependent hydrolase
VTPGATAGSIRPMRAPLCFALVLASCAPFPEGSSVLDALPIAELPHLAHVAEALAGDDERLTAYELVQSGALDFDVAPDPTDLLRGMNALDDPRPATGGTPLRVLTQNVALLDANVFWFVDYARTPLLDERREALFDTFTRDAPDVVMFQEVWLPEDVERFAAAASDAGYLTSVGERGWHDDGLLIAVKESIVDGGAFTATGHQAYEAQDGLEFFPGPGVKRGYQWVKFDHVDAGPMVVFNTHMQAFADQWSNRNKQARELGIVIERETDEGALAFVGGDMNAGPYYARDAWRLPDGAQETVWFANAVSYPLLLQYGGLVDLAIMGRAARDADADVVLGDTVVNDPETALQIPHAVDGWCDDTPLVTFTAWDCNTLYFQQYGGTEPPARLDHVLARDPEGRVRANASSLAFTEQETFGDVDTEPSDHYGVLVDLVIDGA